MLVMRSNDRKEPEALDTLSRLLVEISILLAASRSNAVSVFRDAAPTYKVDTDAITQKVKQEFAAKARAKKEPKPFPRPRKRPNMLLPTGGKLAALSSFPVQKLRRENPLAFLLAPSSRCRPPVAGCAVGFEFRDCYETLYLDRCGQA